MLTAAQENALYTWLNGQTGIAVSWKDQKAPELAYPFAQLKVIAGPTREGMSDAKSDTLVAGAGADPDTLTLTTKGPRLYTVSIDIYSSSDVGGANAQYYASLAEKALEKDGVHVALLTAGIAVVEVLEPVDLDETVNVQWVSRCKFDLRIRVNSTTEETGAAYINKANITGTIGDIALTIAVEEVP